MPSGAQGTQGAQWRPTTLKEGLDRSLGSDGNRDRRWEKRIGSVDRLPPRPGDDNGGMNDVVQEYIDAIASEYRPLFDRIHRLVLEAHPGAGVVLSYQIPTYKVGGRRLFIGVWKHGVSIYGWEQGRDAGFTARHPELKTGKGTIQLRPDDAAGIPDDEFRDLARAALGA